MNTDVAKPLKPREAFSACSTQVLMNCSDNVKSVTAIVSPIRYCTYLPTELISHGQQSTGFYFYVGATSHHITGMT